MWLAAPAAVAVGMTAPHREDWVPWLVAAFAWRASLSTARLDEEREGTGITPVLFGISAVAAYLCLPDTEQIIPLAVVATATAIAAIVQPRVSFGRPGSMALIGLFGWIAAAGGIGRPAATIGGLGTLGVLVLAGGLTVPSNGLFVVMQSGCALVCSRLAGLSHDSRFAALVVAVALSVAMSILVLSARWRPVRYR